MRGLSTTRPGVKSGLLELLLPLVHERLSAVLLLLAQLFALYRFTPSRQLLLLELALPTLLLTTLSFALLLLALALALSLLLISLTFNFHLPFKLKSLRLL